ncbi:hypothetical protein [Kribbella sp. NPDC048915]|uniref:hypothetical protein n=1 Tax=Kribbella sp. NPDC048915 TaxID=3155148 RepID=UPI0033EB7FC3
MRSTDLRRLAHETRFDAWRTDELRAALASVDDELGLPRQRPDDRPRTLNIRLQIYRQRMQRELTRRAAGGGS